MSACEKFDPRRVDNPGWWAYGAHTGYNPNRVDIEDLATPKPQDAGRHRAIREHAFVQYGGDDARGCGRLEDDEPGVADVRCGFYRRHHATMAES